MKIRSATRRRPNTPDAITAARPDQVLARAVAPAVELLERRQLMTVTLSNGLPTSSPDYFAVTSDAAGSTRTTLFATVDTIYQYNAYFDDGSGHVYDLTSYASAPTLQSDGSALSTGSVTLGAGGTLAFSVRSTVGVNTKAYDNFYSFTASGYDLTKGRLFQYMDSDISSSSSSFTSNVLTVSGTTAGTGGNRLLLTTIDPASNIRQAQQDGEAGSHATLSGYAADSYDTLEQHIEAGGFSAPAAGNINTTDLPAETVTGVGPAFGPGDVTTAIAYSFSSSTSASLTTVLGIDTQVAGQPDVDVQGNNRSILDGETAPLVADNTEFGSVAVGSTLAHTFAVDNIGTSALTLTGSPHVKITGANASDFTVTTQPANTVAAAGASPFTIQFKPTATGLRKATVTIASSDPVKPSFTFTIEGTGTPATVTPTLTVAGPGGQSATAGTPHAFTLGSFAETGATSPYTVTVKWGDGTANSTYSLAAPGSLGTLSHTYAAAGTDTVSITVADSASHTSNTATFTATVAGSTPTPTPTGTVAGTVYRDVTGNGLSADDTHLSGVAVALYTDTNGNGVLDAGDVKRTTLTTGTAGTYSFAALPAGKFLVAESVPAGYVRTAPALTDYYAITLTAASPMVSGKDFADFLKLTSTGATGIIYHVNGVAYTDLRGHTFAGATVTATFTVTNPAGEAFSLVSYTAPTATFDAANASQQVVYQQASSFYTPGTYTLSIRVPPTGHFQVDFIQGNALTQFGPGGSNLFYTQQGRLISADNE